MNPRLPHRLTVISACFSLTLPTACAQPTTAQSAPIEIGEHVKLSSAEATLKTHSDGRHVFVTGYVGDKGPFNFIVDTGAAPNVIDKALAVEMGFEKIGEKEVMSGGVVPVTADIVMAPQVTVDGLTIENAEYLTMNLAEMSLGQFHGVIGMEIFREALLTFDPSHERILVSQGELAADGPGVMAYDPETGGFKIMIDAAGRRVSMNLDTGAPGSFTFPKAISDTLPLKGELVEGAAAQLVGGKHETWTATLDGDIQLGDNTYEDPVVTFMDPSSPHGNIGNAVLGELVLIIDQKNQRLAFRAPEPITKKVAGDKAKPRRIGIQLRGMGGGALSVTRVMPGSLGEAAGFMAGDILVELNGKPAADYDMKALGKLFKSHEPLHFVIDRDGEQRDIEIS